MEKFADSDKLLGRDRCDHDRGLRSSRWRRLERWSGQAQFLADLKAMGFAGVQNFPTLGLFDGVMRASFEETGLGFNLEVDMIAMAHKLDLLTTPYVFIPLRQTRWFAPAPT